MTANGQGVPAFQVIRVQAVTALFFSLIIIYCLKIALDLNGGNMSVMGIVQTLVYTELVKQACIAKWFSYAPSHIKLSDVIFQFITF